MLRPSLLCAPCHASFAVRDMGVMCHLRLGSYFRKSLTQLPMLPQLCRAGRWVRWGKLLSACRSLRYGGMWKGGSHALIAGVAAVLT